MEKESTQLSKKKGGSPPVIRDASIAVLLFYALGYLFPERWWGAHFLAFLSPVTSVIVVAISLYFAFFFRLKDSVIESFEKGKLKGRNGVILAAIIAFGVFLMCSRFTMVEQFYGDSPNFSYELANMPAVSEVDHLGIFLDPNILDPKVGERTILNGVVVLAEWMDTDPISAFRTFNGIVAGIYVLLSLLFVRWYFENRSWQLISAILLCSPPFILIFFGHIEIYAPAILSIMAFLMMVLVYFKAPSVKRLLALFVLYFVAGKFHFASVLLLLPALIGITAHYFLREKTRFWSKVNWKKVGLWVLIPFFLIFIFIYVGVLEDHADQRWLENDLPVFERLFLPLYSPEPPLDRYNLLSTNHIFDFFNEILLWSSAGLMLLITFFVKLRKKINWNRPEVIVIGITLICFVGFFFMINPLLGMAVDWDLLALPAPVFLVFIITLSKEEKLTKLGAKFIGPVVAVSLLGLTFIPIHFKYSALSKRFESVGTHTFKSYWITGAADIELALRLENNPEAYEQRLVSVIEELEPFAQEENDREYARLHRMLGEHYLNRGNNPSAALDSYEKAFAYGKEDVQTVSGLVNAYYRTGNFDGAFSGSQILLMKGYPNHQVALTMCIHMALEARFYDAAQAYTNDYLEAYPGDTRIEYIQKNLKERTNLETLKNAFKQ